MSRLLVFCLFTAAQLLSFSYNASVAIISADLSRELSLNAAELGFISSLFFVVFALAQFPVGVSLDRLGPRVVVPGLMFIGALGSLFFAGAQSFAVLALGRAMIGAGMAATLMGALKAFSLWYPPHRFATVSGLLMGIGATGTLVAATPLAWLSETVGWREVFGYGAPVVALSALSILLWTRDAPEGVSLPRGRGGSGSVLAVFRNSHFWRIALMAFFVTGALFAMQSLWAGPYLFDAVGLSRIPAGNVLLAMGVGVAAGFVASGWLADRFGPARVALAGGGALVLCQISLALVPPSGLIPLVFLLFGFSGGGAAPALLAHARLVSPPEMTGRAMSAANLFTFGGAFFLQWGIGMVVKPFPVDAAGHYPPQAYTAALLLTATGALLALILYLPLARRASTSSKFRK